MLKCVILSEIDSHNGPMKLAYFVTPCSKAVILDVGYRYRMLDIDIGCRIYIYWTSDVYIGRPISISEAYVAFCLKRCLIL